MDLSLFTKTEARSQRARSHLRELTTVSAARTLLMKQVRLDSPIDAHRNEKQHYVPMDLTTRTCIISAFANFPSFSFAPPFRYIAATESTGDSASADCFGFTMHMELYNMDLESRPCIEVLRSGAPWQGRIPFQQGKVHGGLTSLGRQSRRRSPIGKRRSCGIEVCSCCKIACDGCPLIFRARTSRVVVSRSP